MVMKKTKGMADPEEVHRLVMEEVRGTDSLPSNERPLEQNKITVFLLNDHATTETHPYPAFPHMFRYAIHLILSAKTYLLYNR
jgi:hypothetical protein